MDETTFSSWTRQERTWFHRKKSLVVPKAKDRGHNFTLYGAIGSCLKDGAAYMIGEATNNRCMQAFCRQLAQERIDPSSRPFLIMDNAGAHTSPETIRVIERYFIPFHQPGYSCKFNSIEWLWSVVKREYRKRVTRIALRRDYTIE